MSLITPRIAVAEQAPPLAVVIAREKKYLSSKTPAGVAMYLLFVTRETVDSCRWTSSAISRKPSGFIASGPYSSFRTWGPIVQAICGLTFSSGLPDLPPAGWGFSYMDHMGADIMAIAILAGLIHRNRTGEGQWIDMACTEAGTTLVGPDLLDYTVNGRPLRREGQPDSNHSHAPDAAKTRSVSAASTSTTRAAMRHPSRFGTTGRRLSSRGCQR